MCSVGPVTLPPRDVIDDCLQNLCRGLVLPEAEDGPARECECIRLLAVTFGVPLQFG